MVPKKLLAEFDHWQHVQVVPFDLTIIHSPKTTVQSTAQM